MAIGDVFRSFASPGPSAQGLAWGEGSLWNCDGNTGLIYQLDPYTGTILRSFASPSLAPAGLAWAEGTLLLVDLSPDRIYQLDPYTGAVLRSFAGQGTVSGLAWSDGALWQCDLMANLIYRLDPYTGTGLRSFASPSYAPAGLAWTEGSLWHCDLSSNLVYQISPGTGAPAEPVGPEVYIQDEADPEPVVRLDTVLWTNLGNDPITTGANADLKRLGGAFYRLNRVLVPVYYGDQGSLERSDGDDIDSNIWTEVIPYNLADSTGVRRVARAVDGTLWAGSSSRNAWNDGIGLHIWKSTDNGLTWARVYTGFEFDPSGYTPRMFDIACDPLDAKNIVMTINEFYTAAKVYYSRDGGGSWTRVSSPGPVGGGMNLRWGDSHRVVLGVSDGVYVSDTFGASWVKKLTGSLTGFLATPWIVRSPKSLQQFVYIHHKTSVASPCFILYLSRNNGEDWSQFAAQDEFVPLGWSVYGTCWAGTFLEDGSLVIGEEYGNGQVLRNPNPFAVPTPAWQNWTYNINALLSNIAGRGMQSKRVELEP